MHYTELNSAPGKWKQYLKAITAKSQKNITHFPEAGMVLRGQKIDADRVSNYNSVCGFRNGPTLPITYPHMLAFPLHMELMTASAFPFALLGLVHVRNNIIQHRPIATTETLDIYCRTGALYAAGKGLEFEIISEVRSGDDIVWESTSTNLSRCKVPDGLTPSPKKEDLSTDSWTTEKWQVASDTGRRYAGVSGDINPIHLYPLTARLFGFPRHIAHGMWIKAHCIAELESRFGAFEGKTGVQVQFKTPLHLPDTVCFSHDPVNQGYAFKVADKNNEKPHLAGRVLSL